VGFAEDAVENVDVDAAIDGADKCAAWYLH